MDGKGERQEDAQEMISAKVNEGRNDANAVHNAGTMLG